MAEIGVQVYDLDNLAPTLLDIYDYQQQKNVEENVFSLLSLVGMALLDFMVKSAIAKVIAISMFFKKFIHNCNSGWFIIKRSVVHNLNAQALSNLKEFGFGTVTISGLFFGM